MSIMRPCVTRLALLALGVLFAQTAALAQAYPVKPIRLVVPYAPGGATDVLARPIASKLAEIVGQPVVIDNKPGGNATIGADNVRQSPADGYALLMGSINHYLVPFFTKRMPYDTMRDFTPVADVCIVPNMLAVHPSVPIQSMSEFVAYAKKNPGKLFYGTTGVGSTHHLGGIMLAQFAKIDIEHVPYKGGNPTMADVLAGAIPMAIVTATTILPQHRAGKLRALGVIEGQRYRGAPEIPAIGETVQGYAMPDTWLGILAPAGLPGPIAAKLNADVRAAVNAPEVKSRLESLGFEVTTKHSPEAFAAEITRTVTIFKKIIDESGIKPE